MIEVGPPLGWKEGTIYCGPEKAGCLSEGEVHVRALPSFQLLEQRVFHKVETGTAGRVPRNVRRRVSLGSGYKGSNSGEISVKMAHPQGGDKSQDMEPRKRARSDTRILRPE